MYCLKWKKKKKKKRRANDELVDGAGVGVGG